MVGIDLKTFSEKEYDEIVNQLLDMNPDPIPKFILLKEFKAWLISI